MNQTLLKQRAAEFVGTFALIFIRFLIKPEAIPSSR